MLPYSLAPSLAPSLLPLPSFPSCPPSPRLLHPSPFTPSPPLLVSLPRNSGYTAATRTAPLQYGCTDAVRLYHCSTDFNAATRAMPLQHEVCHCNTGSYAAATLAVPLHHSCAAATRTVPLQHRCNSGCATATRTVPLQQGYRCNTGSATTARAVSLQHELSKTICFKSCIASCSAAAASASKLQRVRCALDSDSELHGTTALPNQLRCSVFTRAALVQRERRIQHHCIATCASAPGGCAPHRSTLSCAHFIAERRALHDCTTGYTTSRVCYAVPLEVS